MTAVIQKVLNKAHIHHLTSEDLYIEARCVEEYGEWEHFCLMGYSSEILLEAAQCLEKEETMAGEE